MHKSLLPSVLVVLWLAAGNSDSIPHLAKVGTSTRLFVDSQPFLVLGGEVHNSNTSDLDYMKSVWPRLVGLQLNTVLIPVSWELVEPQESNFDFSLVDGLINGARDNHLHLILLWFGSWKNSVSSYVPVWVKTDLHRFPRMQDEHRKNLNILSTFGEQTREADAHAFAALMKHVHEIDGTAHTVIMVQVENEVGVLGPERDFSAAAESRWNAQVPQSLIQYLTDHKETLAPELTQAYREAGLRTSGNWPEIFGSTRAGAEIFMAWQYAQYIDAVATAGKAQYPLPMYVNSWLVQNDGDLAGQYPSGGPVSRVQDIWRAGSSHIDLFSPDIYLSQFRAVCAQYSRSGNPLFIPEANNEPASSNALYAVGQGALGFSVFAPEDLKTDNPIARSYNMLAQLSSLLLETDPKGRVAAVVQERESSTALDLGRYTLFVEYQNKKEEASVPPAAALIINTAENEFIVAGTGLSIRFSVHSAGARIVELLQVEEGKFVNKKWVTTRRLNGDEIDSGAQVLLPAGDWVIQKIKVFRHD